MSFLLVNALTGLPTINDPVLADALRIIFLDMICFAAVNKNQLENS